jgi:hypothetical protein
MVFEPYTTAVSPLTAEIELVVPYTVNEAPEAAEIVLEEPFSVNVAPWIVATDSYDAVTPTPVPQIPK